MSITIAFATANACRTLACASYSERPRLTSEGKSIQSSIRNDILFFRLAQNRATTAAMASSGKVTPSATGVATGVLYPMAAFN